MSSILRVEIARHRFTPAARGAAGDREDLTLVVAPAPRRQLSARALDFDSLPQLARAVGAYLQQQDEASFTAFSTASRVSPVRF